jgi:hypothetical protein
VHEKSVRFVASYTFSKWEEVVMSAVEKAAEHWAYEALGGHVESTPLNSFECGARWLLEQSREKATILVVKAPDVADELPRAVSLAAIEALFIDRGN